MVKYIDPQKARLRKISLFSEASGLEAILDETIYFFIPAFGGLAR